MKKGLRYFKALVMACAILLVLPAIASATPMTGTNWSDEHTLCRTCTVRTGSTVGWWQQILRADGLLCSSDVDGIFGPATDQATRQVP